VTIPAWRCSRETGASIDRLSASDRSLERSERVIERNSRVIEETRRSYEDQLEITRQFMRRNELVTESLVLVTKRLVGEIAAGIEELRAQRSAIFALIDEMRGGGAAPAA